MIELLKCNGFKISKYDIPPFVIQDECFYQINVPFKMESSDDKEFLSILLGEKKSSYVEFYNYPIYTGKVVREQRMFASVFHLRKVRNQLSKIFAIKKQDIEDLLTIHDIDGNKPWSRLPFVQKCILSLEAASICSPLLFFDTAGLDPTSEEKMFVLATQKCNKNHGIIHLSYPLLSDDNEKKGFISVIRKM